MLRNESQIKWFLQYLLTSNLRFVRHTNATFAIIRNHCDLPRASSTMGVRQQSIIPWDGVTFIIIKVSANLRVLKKTRKEKRKRYYYYKESD